MLLLLLMIMAIVYSDVEGCACQAVSRRLSTSESRDESHESQFGIYGRKSVAGAGFSPNASVSACKLPHRQFFTLPCIIRGRCSGSICGLHTRDSSSLHPKNNEDADWIQVAYDVVQLWSLVNMVMHHQVCVTNNNGFWIRLLDLLALLLQLQPIITAHNQWLSQTRSIPYWTTSVFSSAVTDLVLIYVSVTSSASAVRWLTFHS
jgi:hypothetical protein